MANFIVDEAKFLNENAFKHEDKLNSQYARFLDGKTPTMVTYYAINTVESTADSGFQNSGKALGPDSPIRFKEIKDFPIYGLDQIMMDLSEEEQGLDVSFEGEAIILPNTIQPMPNEFFTINYLNHNYLFMVNQINYGTIRSNDYYKINFSLKSMDESSKENLENQTTENYNCIFANIGTREKCLIRSDQMTKILELNSLYADMVEHYKIFFYVQRYNSFVANVDDVKLYDNALQYFINEQNLFNEKNNFDTMVLNVEDTSAPFLLQYNKGFYRALKENKKSLLNSINYTTEGFKGFGSIFLYYKDNLARNIRHGEGDMSYIPEDLHTRIMSGETEGIDNPLWKTVIEYFNNRITQISSIPIKELKEYSDYFDLTLESYVLIPTLLYIMRRKYNEFMVSN